MSVFALPALIALITKVWVYTLTRKSDKTSQAFLWMLAFFAIHNLSELVVISQFFGDETLNAILLKTYYMALLFSLAYMCIFVMSVANKNRHNKFNIIAFTLASLMSLIILSTNWIIAGSIPAGYTVTAIKGAYYFAFPLIVVMSFVWITYTLVKRYLTAIDMHVQLKCFYALFALSPILLISILVIVMMQLGYQYTGAVLLPFASTGVLIIIVLTEKNNDLIQMCDRLPFSTQKKAEKEILSIFRALRNDDVSLATAKSGIEKILLQNALVRSNYNVSLAAKLLKVKRSSLYGMFDRLKIDHKE